MSESVDRRRFVSGAAIALAAPAFGLGADAELRAAHIGIGRRGTGLAARVVKVPGVKVTAICDIDAQARDHAQTLYSRDNPRSHTDYREVLDRKDVDAVIISAPCDLHAEMAVAALAAGKYVYCEKPLGVTPEHVDRVLKAAAKAKTFLQIGQQLRYQPIFREMARRVHDGVAGQLYVIKAQRNGARASTDADANRPTWYQDVKRSGDLIVENAVHNLDICNWLAQSHPESAFGFGKKYFPPPKPAGSAPLDGFSVTYIYPNDVQLEYTQLQFHPRGFKDLPGGQWYFLFGEKGAVDVTKGAFYPHAGEPRQQLLDTASLDKEDNAMLDFFACIREGRTPLTDVKVGATAALTAILGREAIYRRRMVTWKELGVEV